jgi:hypothetical protein
MGNKTSQLKNFKQAIKLIEPKDKPHILEFGVASGTSLKYIKNLAGKKYEYYGFDSFIGLPEDWVVTKNNLNELVALSSSFDCKGKIPEIPDVNFYKGFFNKTLPDYLKIAKNIAFLHMDADLYSSTKEVLFSLNEFIVPGTVIVFDEWIYNHNEYYNDHEAKAFFEWANIKNREYEFYDFLGPIEHNNMIGECPPEQKTVKILK